MTFPVAVGTGPRHSSSRPFPRISRDTNRNGEQSGGSEAQDNAIIAMGTNDDETLTATVFISYHFLPISDDSTSNAAKSSLDSREDIGEGTATTNNDSTNEEFQLGEQLSGGLDSEQEPLQEISDSQFNVIAELRVQITTTTSPFVSNMDAMSSRETKSRVPLGIMRKRRSLNQSSVPYTPNATIEFSSNETHLACLIPLPISYELISISGSGHDTLLSHENAATSTIVIFRIQAQRFSSQHQLEQQQQHILPNLPDYIDEKTVDGDRTKEELENNNMHATKSNDGASSQEEPSPSTATTSPRGDFMSYVAHEPKIVRAPRPLNELHTDFEQENKALPNRSFLRKLSGGISRTSPVQPRTLHCGTCMCSVPSDHRRGKSSSAFSLLLVGTTDGTLLLVDFPIARVRSVALKSSSTKTFIKQGDNEQCGFPTGNGGFNGEQNHPSRQKASNGQRSHRLRFESECNPIVHLSQCTPTQWKPLDVYGEEQGSESKGRITTVLRDGSVNIYTTSFVVSSMLPKDFTSNSSDNRLENGVDRTINVDRSRSNRNNGTNDTGLEMRINLLSTFHASKFSFNVSRLRYMRAKWLNPLLLVLLTRSPYLDEEFLRQQSTSASAMPSDIVMAQVWTVAEVIGKNNDSKESNDEVDGWENPSDVGANIALVSELMIPCGEGLDELAHDTFPLSDQNSVPMSDFCIPSIFPECARGMSILYHRGTDSLAINSQVVACTPALTVGIKARPFCLIWDWKRNVPGLTLASSISYCNQKDVDSNLNKIPFSWFQLGEDDDHGLCAVHVYEQKLSGKRRRVGKNIFSLATLSPLNRFAADGSLSLNEPSAILLHRDSVNFPFLGRPSNTGDISLQWEESRIPPTYVASNGPCQIAAVGKDYGRSIAVAASLGLCVLDLSRMPWMESQHAGHEKNAPSILTQSPRWKQFSSVNDEQRFRVVSMIWWEMGNEDLLLATVQFANTNKLHLVCWSRRSLGFKEDQLLKESAAYFTTSEEAEVGDGVASGVALPPGFHVHSMSIIRDPAEGLPSRRTASSSRALLLLAYVSCHEGASSCVKYAVYQLQATQSPKGKYELVLARNSACGSIPLQLGRSPDFSATESVTGIFLAGGSFLFDLGTETEDHAAPDAIAIMGIVTVFQGLVAVCVNQTGPILYRPSLLENASIGRCRLGYRKSLIVSYWVSGTNGCRVAWNIAKNDGKVYCWSVPCRNSEFDHQSSVELNVRRNLSDALDVMVRGTQLDIFWACTSTQEDHCTVLLPGLEKHSILGEICDLGRSSLWMNGAMTSEREVAMGPFGPFGCVLYAGQRSRKNSSLPDLKSFHVSSCIVAPPQFTPFLFISFLSLSSTPNNLDFDWQMVSRPGHGISNSLDNESQSQHVLARDHIKFTLRHVKCLGSSSSALRIITLKVIELLSDSKAGGNVCFVNQNELDVETILLSQKWAIGKSILNEIVSVVRGMYDALGFATFFLSVGRQLEPHQFNLIFPLPPDMYIPNSPPVRTAEDLFSVSCEKGSLATALSALPLFSCHKESQESVTKLIYHCLSKIEENFRSCSSYTALTSEEDETFLHQLFWFGVKLEDAIEIENSFDQGDEPIFTSDSIKDEDSFDSSHSSLSEESSIDQDTDDFVSVTSSVKSHADDYTFETYSSEESHEVSFLSPCRTPKKPRVGLVKKIAKKLFHSSVGPENKNAREEDAIHEAASSFIISGFDGLAIKNAPCTPIPEVQYENNVTIEPQPLDDKCSENEGGDVLDFAGTSPDNITPPTTVAGAVCLFLCNVIAFGGSHKNEVPNYGWKAVSSVAQLIQGDREMVAITSAGSVNAQSISRTLTTEDFLDAAITSNLLEHAEDKEDPRKIVAFLLKLLTSNCCQQIHSQAFGTVFNLVLLLLLRYDTCPDVQLCRTTLISVGIVSGHLSGRIGELLNLSEETCDVNAIYSLYVAKLDA
ncbi:hypothetical protein ACHAXR_012401 [Thalassiosira sp. AJA248-18]